MSEITRVISYLGISIATGLMTAVGLLAEPNVFWLSVPIIAASVALSTDDA